MQVQTSHICTTKLWADSKKRSNNILLKNNNIRIALTNASGDHSITNAISIYLCGSNEMQIHENQN